MANTGTTTLLSSLTATNAVETINAPIVLEPASATGDGRPIPFPTTAPTARGRGRGARLISAVPISGGITTGTVTLTLNGTNTNANTISGAISNGGASSVAIKANGTGVWELTGNNSYTGLTQLSGGGTLVLSGANTTSGGVQVVAGAAGTTTTLDINSASALGTGTLTLSTGAGAIVIDNTSGAAGYQ